MNRISSEKKESLNQVLFAFEGTGHVSTVTILETTVKSNNVTYCSAAVCMLAVPALFV